MKIFFLTIVLLFVTGCSYPHPNMLPYGSDTTQKYDDPIITDTPLAMPIYTITFENQNFSRCHKKGFCALPPKLYKEDYNKPSRGWSLMSSSNGFAINAEFVDGWIDYGINMSSSVYPSTDREKEIERGNEKYIHEKYQQGKEKNGRKYYINAHLEKLGKENYQCLVFEDYTPRGVKTRTYDCYKFNPERTKTKNVVISFIYTKSPNLPEQYKHLTDEYTYEDLLKRSQRVLDSLYIKDGWDE